MNNRMQKENLPSSNRTSPWIWTFSKRKPRKHDTGSKLQFLGLRIESQEIIVLKKDKDGYDELRVTLSVESIDKLAQDYSILEGKWQIYRSRESVDGLWKIIAENTNSGNLGIAAKVSTTLNDRPQHLVCVYTEDYFDTTNVFHIREQLRKLGVDEPLQYKPDIYTLLGIHEGTHPIPPWRYRDDQ